MTCVWPRERPLVHLSTSLTRYLLLLLLNREKLRRHVPRQDDSCSVNLLNFLCFARIIFWIDFSSHVLFSFFVFSSLFLSFPSSKRFISPILCRSTPWYNFLFCVQIVHTYLLEFRNSYCLREPICLRCKDRLLPLLRGEVEPRACIMFVVKQRFSIHHPRLPNSSVLSLCLFV